MRQQGFALMMTLVLLPLLAAGLAWLFSGAGLMARFEGHPHADRVAYSTASAMASEVNELAVLNRKILASHLMVGHLTTYLSFTRYLKDMIDSVGYLVPFARSFITGGTTLLVQSARIQLQSGIGVALGGQHKWAIDGVEVLQNAGKRSIEEATQQAAPLTLQSVCIGSVCGKSALDAAMLSAIPVIEENPADYARLSMQAMNGLPQAAWHRSRSWQQNVLGLLEARRSGGTGTDSTGRGWTASEKLEAQVKLFFFGLGWRTLADGGANTLRDGFAYRGLPWLLEWRGPSVIPLTITLASETGGVIKAESRLRFTGNGDADLWRPVWRAELTGGL